MFYKYIIALSIFLFFICLPAKGAEVINVEQTATSSSSSTGVGIEVGQVFNTGDHCSVSSFSLHSASTVSTVITRIFLKEMSSTLCNSFDTIIAGDYVLGSKNLTPNTWVNFKFASTISGLKKNTLYYIGVLPSKSLSLSSASGNPYTAGDIIYSHCRTIWTDNDYAFKIYYDDTAGVDTNCYVKEEECETCPDIISTTTKSMFLETISYSATTTSLNASTTLTVADYYFPFLLFLLVIIIFSFTILVCWFLITLFKKR